MTRWDCVREHLQNLFEGLCQVLMDADGLAALEPGEVDNCYSSAILFTNIVASSAPWVC